MPRDDEDMSIGMDDDDLVDDDPIPARRDTRIFHRKKEDEPKKPTKNEEFDEDIFVWVDFMAKDSKIIKCKKCGVPLEGFGFRIAKFLFGVKPSTKKKGLCNKCENKK